MNLHTKLVEAMVKIFEIYLEENGYDYELLPEYDKTCFTEEQFKEMIELANTML